MEIKRYEVRISGPGSVFKIARRHTTLAEAEAHYDAALARSPNPTEAGRGSVIQLIDHRVPKNWLLNSHEVR
jgi:hypothetical protein